MSKKETLSDILSPSTLSQIASYDLMAKVAVDGFVSGLHRSVSHGSGSEFMQYRNYTQGDELKYVDWKVFGRTDRFYTKVFHEETNMNCTIVLDASASMAYKGQRAICSKFKYGSMVAASLAYMAASQGDNPGFFCYSDMCLSHFAPGNASGHLQRILADLMRIDAVGVGKHEKYLSYLAGSLRRRGMLIMISDFLDPDTDYTALFKKLGFAKHEVIILQVLDKDELDLPFASTSRFHDSETGEEIVTASPAIRDGYMLRVSDHIATFKAACHRSGFEYLFADTTQEIGQVLASYLHHRGGGKC